MTCKTNLHKGCSTKKFQRGSIVINIIYVFWLIFTFIEEPSEKLPDIIFIFSIIYFLFLISKICYSLVKRTIKVYNFNISDCLFVLATMKYIAIGFNIYIGLVLIILKLFEMYMYLRNTQNSCKNISLNNELK